MPSDVPTTLSAVVRGEDVVKPALLREERKVATVLVTTECVSRGGQRSVRRLYHMPWRCSTDDADLLVPTTARRCVRSPQPERVYACTAEGSGAASDADGGATSGDEAP